LNLIIDEYCLPVNNYAEENVNDETNDGQAKSDEERREALDFQALLAKMIS